jgi:hypothetical protein
MEILDLVFGGISALPGWLIPAAVVILLALRVVLHLRSWLRRGTAWERMASRLGLQYRSDLSDLSSRFPALGMLATAGGTRWVNVLQGESDGLRVCFADRCGSPAVNRTVCILQSGELHLPASSSRRARGVFDRLRLPGRRATLMDLDVQAVDDTIVVSTGRLIDPARAPELLALAKETATSLLRSRG